MDDDYETAERKQTAIRLLSNYSQFVMACMGQGVPPHQLRLHLMKEISGMPTSLDALKAPTAQKGQGASSSDAACSMDVTPAEPLKNSGVVSLQRQSQKERVFNNMKSSN